MVNGDGPGGGAAKWNGMRPAPSALPARSVSPGAVTAGNWRLSARSHRAIRRSLESQYTGYQLHIGGTAPTTCPDTGAPDAQPRPSGESMTIPKLAMVAREACSPIVTRQRSARTKSRGRPEAGALEDGVGRGRAAAHAPRWAGRKTWRSRPVAPPAKA